MTSALKTPFGPLSTPPLWVSVKARLPRKADADRHDRVWTIALGASGQAYPCETFYQHVHRTGVYTHWASPPVKTWQYPEERKKS